MVSLSRGVLPRRGGGPLDRSGGPPGTQQYLRRDQDMRRPLAERVVERGFNTCSLARQAGIPCQAVSQILRCKHGVHLSTARRIAQALSVSVDDIIFPGEERSEQQPGGDEPSQPEAKAA